VVNIELVLFISLVLILIGLLYRHRDKLKIEALLSIPLRKEITVFGFKIKRIPIIYVALLKTQIGIKFTDNIVKKLKRFKILKYIGYFCILIGFLSIILLTYVFINHIITKIAAPETITGPAVAFVLPFKVAGAIYVPLAFWLISIFIIALVHEFGHALIARYYDIKVKNTGPAFFGILLPLIPAAYVEPDEKELNRRSKVQQLALFSAGGTFNIVLGALAFIVLIFLLTPLTSQLQVYDGVEIYTIDSQSLKDLGVEEGEIIRKISIGNFDLNVGGITTFDIKTLNDLSGTLSQFSPGTKVEIITDKGRYIHVLQEHPADTGKSVIGVALLQHESFTEESIETYGIIPLKILKWFNTLVVWIAILNVGIGIFNLLPMLPLDGGRMVKSSIQGVKFEKPITYGISWIFLGLLILLFVL